MPTRAIKAIFYTRFHHEKGNRVLHQVPAGSITPSAAPSALPAPLFPFSSVTQYLIPTQQFCDRLLTFCVNHHRVIGYPVCIREGKYSRNEFIFNFALVIGENELDWACYGEVVRKLGRLLRGLEEQGGFLSKEEVGIWDDEGSIGLTGAQETHGGQTPGFGSKVYALCEMVLEDLNNYAECMIPIDDSNTINLKLFPTRPPPPPILAHQVPLLTISLATLQTPISSDLTLDRILPYINGVNPVSRIAQLADTDLSLTRRAIQHLVYYGCLNLLDIFNFSAIYALTAEIDGFVADADFKDECARYVRIPAIRTGAGSYGLGARKSNDNLSLISSPASQVGNSIESMTEASQGDDYYASKINDGNDDESAWCIDHETLITLYTSLRQGLILKNWVLENLDLLNGIDVRRFITFGIIKGFVYRVHKHAIATSISLPPAPPTSLHTSATMSIANPHDSDTATIRGQLRRDPKNARHETHTSVHLHTLHPTFALQRPSIASAISHNVEGTENRYHSSHRAHDTERVHHIAGERSHDNGLALLKFLDGTHCFDEICSDLGLPEKEVEDNLRSMGDGLAMIIHR
ncbi:Nitrogen permease regulator 2 [Coniothyrium glycines]